MKVAIIGYGKMGKEIEAILLDRNHSIELKIDKTNASELNAKNLEGIDVAIEFSTPKTAISNYKKCFEAGIPVVSGTTGWLDKLDKLKQEIKDNNASFFYAPNFSIGVNLFFFLNKKMAKLMNNFKQYEVEISETHHTEKLDAPSGTAIHLAEDIIEKNSEKTNWVKTKNNDESYLFIASHRKDKVPGTHIVKYESNEDTLELKHTAHSRKGFAKGAVLAAEWIIGKKGYFSMKDMMDL